MSRSLLALALGLVLRLGGLQGLGGATPPSGPDGFDHEQHRKLFPECLGCHAGISESGRPAYPTSESCASCHDGTIQRRVRWTAPPERPANLRFTHAEHVRNVRRAVPGDSSVSCSACHSPPGAAWLTVRRTIPDQCLDCHRLPGPHLEAPDTACGTCHLSLAQASALPRERVARFEAPRSHKDPPFSSARGHGAQAAGGDRSCAVCHAREFCQQCHVNAPEVKSIQALAPDARALALQADLHAPATHEASRWLAQHGGRAGRDAATCVTCHTQESCMACHRSRPTVVLALPAGGPGRASGAPSERRHPGDHTADFADRHGPRASASPRTCSACHARTECLECHRPNPGAGSGYHPSGFLTRHPAAAFGRQTDCAGCHNPAVFCATCHQQSGLTSSGTLAGGYHDAAPFFLAGHGTAARQSLESCVTCHSERDCLTCHSAQGGRRFSPHGPGFDAERLRRRNPQTCAACHGRAIPGDD